MKTNLRSLSRLLTLVALTLAGLGFSTDASAAALTVTPSSISNTYTGPITLAITGLTNNETVLIEQFFDANTNSVVDAGELMVQSLRVTDGKVKQFGGVRDTNIPGDEDGATNAAIQTVLYFSTSPEFSQGVGRHLFRLSSPTGRFTSVVQPLNVTQTIYAQRITGLVTDGVSPLAGAFVAVLTNLGNNNQKFVAGVQSDASGHYTLTNAAGSYLLFVAKPGYVLNFDAAPSITLTASQVLTTNLTLTAASTRTISGKLMDSVSSNGIPGVQLFFEAKGAIGYFTYTFTDSNGNYSAFVTADQYKINPSSYSLRSIGYLGFDNSPSVDTTAGSVVTNFFLPKETALIYGSVKDNANVPFSGIDLWYSDSNHLFGNDAYTDTNGNYVAGVIAGNWNIGPSSDGNPSLAGYTVNGINVTVADGQAVQANFVAQLACVHLIGKVVNSSGTPQSGVTVGVNATSGGNWVAQADTAGDGSFDLGVSAGSWQVQVGYNDQITNNLIGPSLTFNNVTCGNNVSNINLVLRSVTAQITGIITNTAGVPVSGLYVYANATINGTNYNVQRAQTDASGHYSMGVANGTWSVNVDCDGLTALGYFCVNNKSVTISGANGVANFVASSDSTPPTLSSSSPANGVSGVGLNTPISFTFSEQMRSDYSITWSGNVNASQFNYAWSGDGLTLTCTYNTTWPASATVSWVLNPSSFSPSFSDLSGNYLSSDVSGYFTTVSSPNAPAITTQPQSQFFTNGGSATLSVSATGTAPLSYQWQFEGANISGATNATLTLSALTLASAGNYQVFVSNGYGTTPSQLALLSFFGSLKFYAGTTLAGPVGTQYRVDYADVLGGVTNWITLTNVTLPYSPYLVIDPLSPGKTSRFYRAVLVP